MKCGQTSAKGWLSLFLAGYIGRCGTCRHERSMRMTGHLNGGIGHLHMGSLPWPSYIARG